MSTRSLSCRSTCHNERRLTVDAGKALCRSTPRPQGRGVCFLGGILVCRAGFAARSTHRTTLAAPISIVIFRRALLLITLREIVIDPELSVVLREQIGDALHRGQRRFLVGVEGGHAAI